MRAPILFYIGRTVPTRSARSGFFAVPVHVVQDIPRSGSADVRVLAGRRAGDVIVVHRSDLHFTSEGIRLVPGSHEAIARFGLRELEEVTAVRALRKRIGQRHLTQGQLRRAFGELIALAERVRARTSNDRAWTYFDRDLERERQDGATGAMIISMIDMVLGAADRYTPSPVNQETPAWKRAAALESDANEFALSIRAPASAAPRRWLEVADAFEVAEDAWQEAGDEDRAERVHSKRENILTTIKLA